MTDRVLRRPEVEHKSGLCERQLRTLENENRFPRRFLISEGGRAVGWSESEVDTWLAERIALRETVTKAGMLVRVGRSVAS